MNGLSYDVQWQLGPTTVYGTLVTPHSSGPFPGIVMAAGSGPTDRNWNSPLLPGSNGSALLIANALADAGFASLRYDKRASGPHARKNMQPLMGKLSMRSHTEEFAGGVRLLAERPDIQSNRLFGLGNSEGTLHVLHYHHDSPAVPLAGLILTGPPGRPVDAVTRSQLAAQAVSLPNGVALMALYDAAIARFLNGEPADPDPSLPPGVQDLLRALEAPANLPFTRELWTSDASRLLENVNVPVLVVIGKKDIQVDWQADGERLKQAVDGNPNVTFYFPDNANHVLKHDPKEQSGLVAAKVVSRYNADDAHLDPETTETIIGWLLAQVM